VLGNPTSHPAAQAGIEKVEIAHLVAAIWTAAVTAKTPAQLDFCQTVIISYFLTHPNVTYGNSGMLFQHTIWVAGMITTPRLLLVQCEQVSINLAIQLIDIGCLQTLGRGNQGLIGIGTPDQFPCCDGIDSHQSLAGNHTFFRNLHFPAKQFMLILIAKGSLPVIGTHYGQDPTIFTPVISEILSPDKK